MMFFCCAGAREHKTKALPVIFPDEEEKQKKNDERITKEAKELEENEELSFLKERGYIRTEEGLIYHLIFNLCHKIGMNVNPFRTDVVCVSNVQPGKEAHNKGVVPGFYLLTINDVHVSAYLSKMRGAERMKTIRGVFKDAIAAARKAQKDLEKSTKSGDLTEDSRLQEALHMRLEFLLHEETVISDKKAKKGVHVTTIDSKIPAKLLPEDVVDIALKGRATQSLTPEVGDHGPELAIRGRRNDGKYSLPEGFGTGTQIEDPWWKVRFEEDSLVHRVELYENTDVKVGRVRNIKVSLLDSKKQLIKSFLLKGSKATRMDFNPPIENVRSLLIKKLPPFKTNEDMSMALDAVNVFGCAMKQ
mmetsp:Transcript_21885/g.32615  ORF Transcript_21885/g.32615 Transcript_21885/m.32615 type:complete len:360 (-) Transcript_21885:112-1191(-)